MQVSLEQVNHDHRVQQDSFPFPALVEPLVSDEALASSTLTKAPLAQQLLDCFFTKIPIIITSFQKGLLQPLKCIPEDQTDEERGCDIEQEEWPAYQREQGRH